MISRLILGLGGLRLTPSERELIRTINPLGIILFRRNIANRDQLKTLIAECKSALGNPDLLVMIDQEGGRVRRLLPPLARALSSARQLGVLYARSPEQGLELAHLHGRLLAADLKALGINVNCVPCLDLFLPETHAAIGDRALSADPEVVAELGRKIIEGSAAGGVAPVLKHVPGHGRAGADSHKRLPRVTAELAKLEATDFAPFRTLNAWPAMMTSHVVYEALDAERPATTSSSVINKAIRGSIGFQGLLFSDDLSMAALSGSLARRAERAWDAGIDIALYCRGKLPALRALAEVARPMNSEIEKRADAFVSAASKAPEPFDLDAGARRYGELLPEDEALS